MFETLAADATRLCLKAVANATVTVGTGSFRVCWENEYDDVMGVSTSEPRATFLDEDLAELDEGVILTKDGVKYAVRTVEPDGMGATVCTLRLMYG
jgi:hypothetical protein